MTLSDDERIAQLYRALGVAMKPAPAPTPPAQPIRAPQPARQLSPAEHLGALTKPIQRAGLVIIAICFGGFGAWASLAPLASAAIAPGIVSPDGSRKTIQHLEGGIIREILVKEGETVRAGQVLVRLEATQAQANFSSRREGWLRLRATKARLEAQEADLDTFLLPPDLAAVKADEFVSFLKNQVRMFDVRRSMLAEREAILSQQIKQLDEEVRGRLIENAGLEEQLKLIEQELQEKKFLIDRNLARRPDYYAVQRTASGLKSKVGSNLAEVSRAQQKIEEVRLQINSQRTQFRDQVAAELTKTNADLAQLEEAMIASGDILKRTDVIAPIDGTALNLRVHTLGGVVRPGDTIVDLVPSQGGLIIDARMAPTDIDVVRIGMPAEVQISSYTSRFTPMLRGRVTSVGADALVDQVNNQRYYPVKITIDQHFLEALTTTIELTPGMPAEAFILTGQRTALAYFRDPIVRSFRRAFRED